MSAAEKLKAMEAAFGDISVTAEQIALNADTYARALPQIVAVVGKAEEPVWDRKHQRHVCSQCGAEVKAEHRPGCALAALDEALS